jgi:hypothetical protein
VGGADVLGGGGHAGAAAVLLSPRWVEVPDCEWWWVN